MKKRIALLLSVCMTLGLLAGCSKKEESAPAPEAPAKEEQPAQEEKEPEAGDEKGDGKYTFGVSLFYRSDEFYVDIENMMKVYGEEAGVELIIQDANCDASTQMRQFEDFIQMGVDAILFSPCDPAACASAVEAANDYPASPIVCGQRADGFQEAVEELEGVKVVARQDGKATRTGGMEVMENILTANNNEVDLVFAINYESGAGAAAAIEAADAKGGVVCVAWGEEALQKVENNDPYLKGVLLGDPSDQAEIINVAKDYLDGKDIEKETYYSYYMVTSEDLNEKIDWKAIIDLRN